MRAAEGRACPASPGSVRSSRKVVHEHTARSGREGGGEHERSVACLNGATVDFLETRASEQ